MAPRLALAASLVALLGLTACGGGGDGGVTLEVGVVVEGQPVGGTVRAGGTQSVVMSAGQSIELDATFRSTTDVTYSWLKNGQPISDAKTSSYTIPTAKVSDSGTYSLTATNSAGSTLASFQVDVISTPWKGWVNRTPSGTGWAQS